MKYGRRASPPRVSGPDQLLSVGSAASLLTERIRLTGLCKDEWRPLREKLYKQIKYAIAGGRLPSTDDRVTVAALAHWAYAKHGELGLPRHQTVKIDKAREHDVASALQPLPSTIDACHALLRDARSQIEVLEERLRACEAKLAEESALADQTRKRAEENRANARRPRSRQNW